MTGLALGTDARPCYEATSAVENDVQTFVIRHAYRSLWYKRPRWKCKAQSFSSQTMEQSSLLLERLKLTKMFQSTPTWRYPRTQATSSIIISGTEHAQ
ncbi:hypothetical protein RSAG8_11525, partial [Rhizoctonia solani AG-8 WAC10335]